MSSGSQSRASGDAGPRPALRRRFRRWWRARVRPIWRETRLLFFFAAAATLFVLGYIGYRSQGYRFYDSIYGAIDNFIPAAFPLDLDISSWQLEVARGFGPVLTGLAVVRALYALTRDQTQLLWLRVVMRDHVVIAGLGTVGSVLAESLQEAGFRVVGIELQSDNDAIGSARESGVRVIVGNALDVGIL